MLKRVRIKGFKSLHDLEVTLQPLTVILGPNASGKSNFLDCLQLLSRMVTSKTIRDAFEDPYRGRPLESFTFGPRGITDLLNRKKLTFSIEADVELSPSVIREVERQVRSMRTNSGRLEWANRTAPIVTEKRLRYTITVEMIPKTGILRVADEHLVVLGDNWKPVRKREPLLQAEGYLSFRVEGETFFLASQQETNRSILSLPLYPPQHPHLSAFKLELESWHFFYFEPREQMRATNPVREVRHIGLMGQDLASYLNTLKAINPGEFERVERDLNQIIPSVTGIDININNIGEIELRIKEGEALIPSRVVSEGTLRILGLLALTGAKEPPALLGFEEPENGIHPYRIRMIAEYLKAQATRGESQVIVTTHSPTLIDLMPDEFLYICRKEDQYSIIKPYEEWDLKSRQEISTFLNAEVGTGAGE